MRITALSHPAFACDACGSPKVSAPAEPSAGAALKCHDCGIVLGTWGDFVGFVERRAGRLIPRPRTGSGAPKRANAGDVSRATAIAQKLAQSGYRSKVRQLAFAESTGQYNWMEQQDAALWRAEIDSLVFRPDGHEGFCFIHRLAFRTILGFVPTPKECAALFNARSRAFHAAAQTKIERRGLRRDANFHLTSRDVLREMKAAAIRAEVNPL
jgi:hypothetical protein